MGAGLSKIVHMCAEPCDAHNKAHTGQVGSQGGGGAGMQKDRAKRLRAFHPRIPFLGLIKEV